MEALPILSFKKLLIQQHFQNLEEMFYVHIGFDLVYFTSMLGAVGQSVQLACRRFWCSNPGRDRPKSLKQLATAPLLNTRQQVGVSWVLGNDHYKRVSLKEASLLNGHECQVQDKICSDVVKNSQVGRKAPNKRTNINVC